MNVDDYLDLENPADSSAELVYQRLRSDERLPGIIEKLEARGLTGREIVTLFRQVSRIPSEWEIDKEARQTKEKRRGDITARLQSLLPMSKPTQTSRDFTLEQVLFLLVQLNPKKD